MRRTKEVRLREHVDDRSVQVQDFELVESVLPPLGEEEVHVRNLWLSVDPYMRSRMRSTGTYMSPFALRSALTGAAIGQVVASNCTTLQVGTYVKSMLGWREEFISRPEQLSPLIDEGFPMQAYLGAAGNPGLSAYVGLVRIANLRAGDTVFVSGAAGAVGQIACQIARNYGCIVIGSAGGAGKVEYLRSLGVQHIIDYKAESDLVRSLSEISPNGIDVYFDNVGGRHLEAALSAARPGARFALCGMISEYDRSESGPGIRNLFAATTKDISMHGFLVNRHDDLRETYLAAFRIWYAEKRMRWQETVEVGLENAPNAFVRLFQGGNVGKMLVKLADPITS